MAEETAARRSGRMWSGISPLRNLALSDYRVPLVAVALALVTFATYWYVGPQNTVAVQYVNQANAFLHGRLDIVPELAKNYNLIEKACLKVENNFCTPDSKIYITHGPVPAVILVPGVLLFGLNINATLVSVVFGGMTAPVVFAIARRLTDRISVQVWLTILFMFGTIFWYTASHGGVWFFSHTVGVFFLLLAIWAALGPKNPVLAGFCLGAAYLSRSGMILALPFFLIMFSDRWLHWDERRPLLKRVDLTPLVQLGSGLAVFMLAGFVYNYLRFENPFDSGYFHSEQYKQVETAHVYNHGPFHLTYIDRHIPPTFELMPRFQEAAPYVLPSYLGTAIWVTTPAFLLTFFAALRDRRVIIAGVIALALSIAYLIWRAIGFLWDANWDTFDTPNVLPGPAWGLHLLPFYVMVVIAVASGVRQAILTRGKDKLVIASWSAVILIAFSNFVFAATGWAQFGYRYALDFYPFLFLLTVKAIGNDLKWWHVALILLSVAANLWGVLWIYHGDANQWNGWRWVTF